MGPGGNSTDLSRPGKPEPPSLQGEEGPALQRVAAVV